VIVSEVNFNENSPADFPFAGRIVVLTEDGIAEEGAHAELVSSGGAYARLYNTQASM